MFFCENINCNLAMVKCVINIFGHAEEIGDNGNRYVQMMGILRDEKIKMPMGIEYNANFDQMSRYFGGMKDVSCFDN